MRKEEMVLFPFIKDLEFRYERNLSPAFPAFGTVRHPVRMMCLEHDTAGELLRDMRKATDDYLLPEHACPSFTALYHRLIEFERDLHQHIHLENNLLFPQAVELERKALEL